ncbi:hypothetical protein K8O93_00930 [Gordonia bronchialis]|uniref:hypothetical protein n=1 Tax=Gordonia bronchialis TaxID=2054 RepID=UPI001CBCD7BE|nr:hypothetical protein [Gordonia bronchialis]UAK38397.1 hypothetical protein K8O93_00930 [Gordonia bronchialis]
MTSRSDVRALIKRAKKRGWVLDASKGKGGHHRLRFPPTGDVVTVSATPSDYRSIKNAEALINRISGRVAAGSTRRGTSGRRRRAATTTPTTVPFDDQVDDYTPPRPGRPAEQARRDVG